MAHEREGIDQSRAVDEGNEIDNESIEESRSRNDHCDISKEEIQISREQLRGEPIRE